MQAGGSALKPAIQDIDIVVTVRAMSANTLEFYKNMFELPHLPAVLLPSYIRLIYFLLFPRFTKKFPCSLVNDKSSSFHGFISQIEGTRCLAVII